MPVSLQEAILNKLQSSVESEEQKWKEKVKSSDTELQEVMSFFSQALEFLPHTVYSSLVAEWLSIY